MKSIYCCTCTCSC